MEINSLPRHKTKKLFKLKDLQNILAVFYLLMVAIGMVFEYFKYRLYGINIFEYASIFDFLIAPFRDPIIFVFAFSSILLIYVIYIFDTWIKDKYGKVYSILMFKMDKLKSFEKFRKLFFVLWCIFYIFGSAHLFGKTNRDRPAYKKIKVEIVFSDDDVIKGIMIGKTDEVIFLQQDAKVHIVPYKSLVKKIVYP